MTFLFHRKDLIPLLIHAKKSINHSGGYEEGPVGPGLLLVSDSGVYLMSNGIPRGTGEQVVYADGHGADTHLGGDDFAEFLPLDNFKCLASKGVKYLIINLTDENIEILTK